VWLGVGAFLVSYIQDVDRQGFLRNQGDAPVLAVGFGPDESSLTTVTSSTVSKWTLRTVRLLASSQYGDQLRFLALGPNTDLFATVNPNNEVCVHRLSTPEQLVLLPHTDLVTAAVFSPDSSFLALSQDG